MCRVVATRVSFLFPVNGKPEVTFAEAKAFVKVPVCRLSMFVICQEKRRGLRARSGETALRVIGISFRARLPHG